MKEGRKEGKGAVRGREKGRERVNSRGKKTEMKRCLLQENKSSVGGEGYFVVT